MVKNWTYSNNRKKYQRKMNYYMRKINKNIENDDLWRGRFVMRQDCAQWARYVDGSGHTLYIRLYCVDKKTGRKQYFPMRSVNSLCFWNGHKLWEMMNNFIVDYLDVWTNEGREILYSDKTDYRKVEI